LLFPADLERAVLDQDNRGSFSHALRLPPEAVHTPPVVAPVPLYRSDWGAPDGHSRGKYALVPYSFRCKLELYYHNLTIRSKKRSPYGLKPTGDRFGPPASTLA